VRLKFFDNSTARVEKAFEIQTKVKSVVDTYVTTTAIQVAMSCRSFAIVDQMSAMNIDDQTFAWRPWASDERFLIHLAYSPSRKRSQEAHRMMDLIRESAAKEQRRLDLAVDETLVT